MQDKIAQAKKEYDEIYKNRDWIDQDGYDKHLEKQWFDAHAGILLNAVEVLSESNAEQLRFIAFHITSLVEALQEQNAIPINSVKTSCEMVAYLNKLANQISPERQLDKTIQEEHLHHLQQLRSCYGNAGCEGNFLDKEIDKCLKNKS